MWEREGERLGERLGGRTRGGKKSDGEIEGAKQPKAEGKKEEVFGESRETEQGNRTTVDNIHVIILDYIQYIDGGG